MLTFVTTNTGRDWKLCRQFARDGFMQSFGNLDRMPEPEEFERLWLEDLIEQYPDGCVHAWLGDTIVGELRMTITERSRTGYLYFIYVVPEQRGASVADALHDYALSFFRKHNATHARLSVSPTNLRANAFYDKHGWQDLGPRPDAEYVHLRELRLDAI